MNSPFQTASELRTVGHRTQAVADGDLISLPHLMRIARRQMRVVALCALAGALVGLVYLATATRLYTATTMLSMKPSALQDGQLGGTLPAALAGGIFDSEIEILLSEKIAADVVASVRSVTLELPDGSRRAWPLRAVSGVAHMLARLAGNGTSGADGDAEARRRQTLLVHLRRNLALDRAGTGYVFRLSYTSPSPERSAEILNGFVQAYVNDRVAEWRAIDALRAASLDAQVAATRDRLAAANTAAAAAQEKLLRQSLEAARTSTIEAARAAAELQDLRSQLDAYRMALNELLVRRQEIGQADASSGEAVRVISPAAVPIFDSAPDDPLVLVMATLAGALGGVGLGLLREGRDTGLRTASQVRRTLGIRCLGLLRDLGPDGQALRIGGEPCPLAPNGHAEILRGLKLAIDQVPGISNPKVIGFAPSRSGDGATTTATNFAALLAAGGRRTLLIDADLREAGLSDALGLAGKRGFSDLVRGESVPEDCFASEPGSGLHLCSAGTERGAAIASVALAAPEIGAILSEAAAAFHWVVLDLPPLDRFVDARAMARALDAIVVVAGWGRTTPHELAAGLGADPDLRQKVVGVVLNRVDMARMRLYDDDFPADPA